MSCDDDGESLNNNCTGIFKNNDERKYCLRSFIEINLVIIVNVVPSVQNVNFAFAINSLGLTVEC